MSHNLDEFFQKSYEQETDRKHQLASYLPLRVTLTIIVGGILGNNVSNGGSISSVFQCLGFTLASIGSIALLITVFYLIKFHFGHSYHYLSYPDQTSEFIENLKSFHADKLEEFEKDAKRHLRKEYIECGAENMRINDKRSSTIYKADRFLGIAAVIAMFSYWSYVGDTLANEKPNIENQCIKDDKDGRSIGQTCARPNASANAARAASPASAESDQRKRSPAKKD